PIAANDVWFGAGFGVAHYDGTKITPLVENINTIWGSFYGIWGAASNDVWMAGTLGGSDARFAHWDGAQLTFTTMTGMNRLNAIRGASATDIWAVGVGGTALHWDGQAWTNRPVPGSPTLQSVWVRTSSDVWAVGDAGVAFHWDGQAWNETPTGETNGLQTVWGSAANDVWAFGNYGATVHWNGTSWEKRWRGTIAFLNTVWGADQNDIWIAGASGAGMRWDGTTLRDAPFPTTIYNLHGTARDDVWAVGATGILHYDGNTWTPATGCGSGMYMGSVRALSRTNVWASGGPTLCHF